MTIQLHGLKTTGLVPIGGVVATIPALAGAYACTATTAADDLGYVVCGGQVINDATSPLNGRTIPNINNDVFLKGHTTSNTAGGNNTHTHGIPDHTHSVPGHYHYYGGHWSNDNSTLVGDPYGDLYGNTYDDTYGYRAYVDVDGNGNHQHNIPSGNVAGVGYSAYERSNNSNNVNVLPTTNTAGWHGHGAAVRNHRHWLQTRTTHNAGGLDGRNAMTSGSTSLTSNSSSTEPKFITVLYVMRVK